jgi:peptidoglycan/xylan/chitin deacetylase (PgdA/CDA1 family)
MTSDQKLTILAYHRVQPEADALSPYVADILQFRQHMKTLKRYFNVVTVSEGIGRICSGTLPPRSVAISFDDGYRDNAEIALPVLQEYGLSATFYVATGFLGAGRMWNDTIVETIRRYDGDKLDASRFGIGVLPTACLADRRATIATLLSELKYRDRTRREHDVAAIAEMAGVTLPTDLMMKPEQVRTLYAAGMEIGGHTVNHPILARTEADEARREIQHGREQLEALLGESVTSFAYPNGRPGQDYTHEHVQIVRDCGFTNAVSTSRGTADSSSDLFQLPRISVWDRSSSKFALRLFLMRQGWIH